MLCGLIDCLVESNEGEEVDDEMDDGEDEAMAAIREMQQAEEEEQARIEAEEKVLQQQAVQIEKEAAQKEREQQARINKQQKENLSAPTDSSSSRQFGPKGSSGLKASSGGVDVSEELKDRHTQQSPHSHTETQQESPQQSFGDFAARINEKKQQQQRRPNSIGDGSTGGIGMGSTKDALGEIEARLREAQQQHYRSQQHQQSQSMDVIDGDDDQDDETRLARYAVEYRHKRPVEKIIKAYKKKPIFDLYAIVGVDESADATDVKFGYREMALLIHPDKNPHPKAKLAFDFLQEAYKILTSMEEKEAYDKKLMKLRSTKLRLHKLKKKLENFYHNSKSKVQMLQHQGTMLSSVRIYIMDSLFFLPFFK